MASENTQKELVLTPIEYCYILDETKGQVSTMVGPMNSSLSGTMTPVVFDEKNYRFVPTPLESVKKLFSTIPEGWYGQLKNPGDRKPNAGASNNLIDLDIGRKINIPGPTSFPLWPGQMIRIIPGHSLRTNQYLVIRIYDEKEAFESWEKVGLDKITNIKAIEKGEQLVSNTEIIPVNIEDQNDQNPEENQVKKIIEMPLVIGQQFVIRGVDTSFFIPPNGIEVVPETPKGKDYVREALTLERLEYCILLDEDGNKRYVVGPAVVFPTPTESFLDKDNIRKFKALELTETSGIHIKVIASYIENEGKPNAIPREVGEELFLTGKENMIYIPRQEHAIMKYGESESIYYAISIEPGEARYVLNKITGEIRTERGPKMLLPDPRTEVIVRRVLSDKEASLYYPGNHEVKIVNASRRGDNNFSDMDHLMSSMNMLNMEDDHLLMNKSYPGAMYKRSSMREEVGRFGSADDSFTRKDTYTPPRTITINAKYEGAVRIDVWSGYSIQVVNRMGSRRILHGPQTVLLDYDERLEALYLSTGKPKDTDDLLTTVYLRSKNNKISDKVTLQTKDFTDITLNISYLIDFDESQSDKWFDVDNYIKLLCDRMRSKLKKEARAYDIIDFYEEATDIVHDVCIEEEEKGTFFSENGMWLRDVELLGVQLPMEISRTISDAKLDLFKSNILLASDKVKVENEIVAGELAKKSSEARMDNEKAKHSVNLLLINQRAELQQKEEDEETASLTARLDRAKMEKKAEEDIKNTATSQEAKRKEILLDMYKREELARAEISGIEQTQEIELMEKETEASKQLLEAFSPQIVQAIEELKYGDHATEIATAVAPLAQANGVSVLEVLTKLSKGSVYEEVFTNMFNKGINQ